MLHHQNHITLFLFSLANSLLLGYNPSIPTNIVGNSEKEFALCSRYNFSSLFMACVCVDARVAKAAPAGRPVCRAWLDANAFCSPDVLKASGLFFSLFSVSFGPTGFRFVYLQYFHCKAQGKKCLISRKPPGTMKATKEKREKSIRSVLQKAPPRGFRKKKDAFRANKGVWQINSFLLFALFAKKF